MSRKFIVTEESSWNISSTLVTAFLPAAVLKAGELRGGGGDRHFLELVASESGLTLEPADTAEVGRAEQRNAAARQHGFCRGSVGPAGSVRQPEEPGTVELGGNVGLGGQAEAPW